MQSSAGDDRDIEGVHDGAAAGDASLNETEQVQREVDALAGPGDSALTMQAPPEPAAIASPVPASTAVATAESATFATAPPATELTNGSTRTLFEAIALTLSQTEASALRQRIDRAGVDANDPRIASYLRDVLRESKRTVLDEIEEALGPDRGARVRRDAERLGLDPNDPRLVGYALNQDLEATLERLPDEAQAAVGKFAKTLDASLDRVTTAFDTGIERVESAAATYGAKELVTFDVAFAKVASDRIERLVKETVKAVQSPWNRWATVAIVIVGLSLAWVSGWWTGRAQFADHVRSYEARYAPMTKDVRRFADGLWR